VRRNAWRNVTRSTWKKKWKVIYILRDVKVSMYMHIFHVSQIYWNFVENFLFNADESIREYMDTYDAPLPKKVWNLSQFCRKMVQALHNEQRSIDGLLLFRNFCRGSSCDRALTTSERYSVFHHLVLFIKDTSIHRPIVTTIMLYVVSFIHIRGLFYIFLSKTATYIYIRWKTGKKQEEW